MSRKDAILLAILLNMGIMAVLFSTAVVYEEESSLPVLAHTSLPIPSNRPMENLPKSLPRETEVAKRVELTPPSSPPPQPTMQPPPSMEVSKVETISPSPSISKKNEIVREEKKEQYIEIAVKEGDALEKIARAHHTSVATIKEKNHLTTEKIRPGQILRIPISSIETGGAIPVVSQSAKESEFYVVESGDNPWTIAKKCHVRYTDILALNHLDEEKARNLKKGDRIRIR